MGTRALAHSLADHAAERIRRLIVEGILEPGQALSEAALATDLGVSKTPIREALLRLETEGLVQILPQRGTFVFQLSVIDAHALSAFRTVLEIEALQLAMRHDRAALASALRSMVNRMKPARTTDQARDYRALDDLFHRSIIEHCHNSYLSDAYESIALLVQTLRNRLTVDARLNARSLKDHRELVDLIEKGHAQKAATLLKQHIARTPADYAKRMPSADNMGGIVKCGSAAIFPTR